MAAAIRTADVNTIIRLTIRDQAGAVVDVSSAIAAGTKEIIFKGPDGSLVTKPAVFQTNGTDGGIQYLKLAADFSVAGAWTMQGHVILADGEWYTSRSTFMVRPVLS